MLLRPRPAPQRQEVTIEAKRIRLTKEKETYLATLCGKAMDAAVENPILGDRFAADAVAHIDYDFTRLKLLNGGEITLPMRAWHLDQWTRAFLAANPESTVLHVGCGLDTRVYRIEPGPKVHWFDVDFPDVIAPREQLYPERDGYRRIGSSVTDLTWRDAIPGDMPALVVAEGLLMYLHEKDGTALFRADHPAIPEPSSGLARGRWATDDAASWGTNASSIAFSTARYSRG